MLPDHRPCLACLSKRPPAAGTLAVWKLSPCGRSQLNVAARRPHRPRNLSSGVLVRSGMCATKLLQLLQTLVHSSPLGGVLGRVAGIPYTDRVGRSFAWLSKNETASRSRLIVLVERFTVTMKGANRSTIS
jgi:hypothetical protein